MRKENLPTEEHSPYNNAKITDEHEVDKIEIPRDGSNETTTESSSGETAVKVDSYAEDNETLHLQKDDGPQKKVVKARFDSPTAMMGELGGKKVELSRDQLVHALNQYTINLKSTENVWKSSVSKEYRFKGKFDFNIKYDINTDIKNTNKQAEFYHSKQIEYHKNNDYKVSDLTQKLTEQNDKVKKLELKISNLESLERGEGQLLLGSLREGQSKAVIDGHTLNIMRLNKTISETKNELEKLTEARDKNKSEYNAVTAPLNFMRSMESDLVNKLEVLQKLKEMDKK